MNFIQRTFRRAAFAIGAFKATGGTARLFPKYMAEQAKWIITGNENYISEGFLLNAIVYSAIMYKVRASQSAPMMAYTGSLQQREPLPAAHPLARLLERPNPWQSFIELDAESRVYFNLFGNAYIYFKRKRGSEYPEMFFNLPPYKVNHLYKNGALAGFAYTPIGGTYNDRVVFDARDVMHVRNPNPADAFLGMGRGASALSPAAQSVDVDNALTAYLKQFIDFGAMPPGILSTSGDVSENDAATYRQRFMEIYGGSHNWTDIAVLGNGSTYQAIGSRLNELASNLIDARTENRTAMVFGVPLPLIETNPQIVQSTYSNLEQYEVFFWRNTMIPELRWFGTEYRYFLRGEDGSFPAYDLGDVPALRAERDEHGKIILDGARSGFFTRAEVKASLGEPFDPDLDNVYLLPFNVQMLPALPAPTQDDTGGAEAVADEDQREDGPNSKARKFTLTTGQKTLCRKQFEAVAERYVDRAERAAREAFETDRREIFAIINAAKSKAYAEAKNIQWMIEFMSAQNWLQDGSQEQWRDKFKPVFNAVAVAQGERLETTFGIAFDATNVLTNQYLENYEFTFVDPISQTSIEEIRAIFEQAALEGWSVDEIQENLDILFKQWIVGNQGEDLTEEQRQETYFATNRLPPYRARAIARTEMIRASNAGSMAVYDDWGVQRKEWFSTGDTHTRETHRVGAAWGQDPLITSMGEPFTLPTSGAALQFPGDPNAPLSETIQCRCTVLPVIDI